MTANASGSDLGVAHAMRELSIEGGEKEDTHSNGGRV